MVTNPPAPPPPGRIETGLKTVIGGSVQKTVWEGGGRGGPNETMYSGIQFGSSTGGGVNWTFLHSTQNPEGCLNHPCESSDGRFPGPPCPPRHEVHLLDGAGDGQPDFAWVAAGLEERHRAGC